MDGEPNLPLVELGDFSCRPSFDGDKISLQLSGNADLSAREAVESVLLQLHSEVQRLGIKEVILDIKQLEFMNSSCFKGFVSWLCDVRELEPREQYQIHFLSNAEMLWQRRSMHALQAFAASVVTVDL